MLSSTSNKVSKIIILYIESHDKVKQRVCAAPYLQLAHFLKCHTEPNLEFQFHLLPVPLLGPNIWLSNGSRIFFTDSAPSQQLQQLT